MTDSDRRAVPASWPSDLWLKNKMWGMTFHRSALPGPYAIPAEVSHNIELDGIVAERKSCSNPAALRKLAPKCIVRGSESELQPVERRGDHANLIVICLPWLLAWKSAVEGQRAVCEHKKERKSLRAYPGWAEVPLAARTGQGARARVLASPAWQGGRHAPSSARRGRSADGPCASAVCAGATTEHRFLAGPSMSRRSGSRGRGSI